MAEKPGLEAIGTPDQLLRQAAITACRQEGFDFVCMPPDQRVVVTHFRCSACKMQPLYCLDLRYPKRPRCRRCGGAVSIRGTGRKYGRIRKRIGLLLYDTGELTTRAVQPNPSKQLVKK